MTKEEFDYLEKKQAEIRKEFFEMTLGFIKQIKNYDVCLINPETLKQIKECAQEVRSGVN